jgi:hypothetical protein
MRTYSIADLLHGTYYRPTSYARKHMGGFINYAEKRDNVYLSDGYEAYSIRFRVDGSILDKWATIAVKVAD